MCSTSVQLAPALSATAVAPTRPDIDPFFQPSPAGPGLPDPGVLLDAPPTVIFFLINKKHTYTGI